MLCSACSAQPVVFTSIVFLYAHTHSDGPEVSEEPPKQSEVFTMIEASKLHGALDNAMKLGSMEVCVCVCVCVVSFPGSPLTPTKIKMEGKSLVPIRT